MEKLECYAKILHHYDNRNNNLVTKHYLVYLKINIRLLLKYSAILLCVNISENIGMKYCPNIGFFNLRICINIV